MRKNKEEQLELDLEPNKPCKTKIRLSQVVKDNSLLHSSLRAVKLERIALYKFMEEVGVLETWNDNKHLYIKEEK